MYHRPRTNPAQGTHEWCYPFKQSTFVRDSFWWDRISEVFFSPLYCVLEGCQSIIGLYYCMHCIFNYVFSVAF